MVTVKANLSEVTFTLTYYYYKNSRELRLEKILSH